MHVAILRPEPGEEIDHKNHNTLDNRRENLRRCTHRQNLFNQKKPSNNTSGFKGVYLDKRRNKWRASIMVNNKTVFLGHYLTATKAAQAYDVAAKKFYGEFAHFNLSC
jgi:hypothetical protein